MYPRKDFADFYGTFDGVFEQIVVESSHTGPFFAGGIFLLRRLSVSQGAGGRDHGVGSGPLQIGKQ